jgi:glycosyltransferase involved in cell wall biosynthesis
MKVLALVPDFVEKPSGGLGEQYRNMMQKLDSKVQYYTVGYPEQNSIPNYKSAVNPIAVFNHASLVTIFGQSIYFLKALEYQENFDVIHAFDWSTFYAGYLCKQHFKKPLVCTVQLSLKQLNKSDIFYCHDPNTIDGRYINQLQIYFEELGLLCADKVIQVSEYYNNLYPDYKEKSKVITNGIDIDKWVKKRTPKLPGKNKLKFCYIGRSSPMKGLDVILNCNIPNDIDFYFVVSPKNAEEPIFSYIKQKTNNVNIFHIPGLYGQDKIDFLYSMDGVVMPSKHEPFGIVALEALISENLFITTASGGIKEIVDDIKYFKIETSNDLLNVFEKIKTLSEEEKNNIVKIGKEKASKYDWQIFADQLYDLYKEVTTEKPTLEWY